MCPLRFLNILLSIHKKVRKIAFGKMQEYHRFSFYKVTKMRLFARTGIEKAIT